MSRPRSNPPEPLDRGARVVIDSGRPVAIKRFQRRGRSACRSEWRLIAATHNLLKLHNHKLAAATP
jgi:predicted GTPase